MPEGQVNSAGETGWKWPYEPKNVCVGMCPDPLTFFLESEIFVQAAEDASVSMKPYFVHTYSRSSNSGGSFVLLEQYYKQLSSVFVYRFQDPQWRPSASQVTPSLGYEQPGNEHKPYSGCLCIQPGLWSNEVRGYSSQILCNGLSRSDGKTVQFTQ